MNAATATNGVSPADPLSRAIARVAPTTIVLGLCAAGYEFATRGWRAALAVAVGATISWLNYRWLRGAVLALAPISSQAAKGDVSRRTLLKFLARIALLLLALYVILTRSRLPAVPLLAGLFAAVAAVLAQMSYVLATGGANAPRRGHL
jgi:ATP synthase I chain